MFYPAEGEFMQLLGLPPVNLDDSNLHVCELLEINYRTPVGDRWVVVDNIEIDYNLDNFLMLKGETISGKVVRRIHIRMKRVPDPNDPSIKVERWDIKFGAPLVKSPMIMERVDTFDSLRLVRRIVTGWAVMTWLALIFGIIGTRGLLSQIIFMGVLTGLAHLMKIKEEAENRRYAWTGMLMIILPFLAMICASLFGLQRYLT